jgi:hypothetical protein
MEVPMLTTLVLALLAAPTPQAPRAAAPAHCDLPRVTFAGPAPVKAQPQKLGEQPPANHYLAVDRNVGGCPAPAIVRTGIGGSR